MAEDSRKIIVHSKYQSAYQNPAESCRSLRCPCESVCQLEKNGEQRYRTNPPEKMANMSCRLTNVSMSYDASCQDVLPRAVQLDLEDPSSRLSSEAVGNG